MKRLSSFGFVPCQQSSEKRVRHTHDRASIDSDSAQGHQPASMMSSQPELGGSGSTSVFADAESFQNFPSRPPFVRHDIGTYSRQDMARLCDGDRLWLLENAFRPDATFKYPQREEYGKNPLISKCMVAAISLALLFRIM